MSDYQYAIKVKTDTGYNWIDRPAGQPQPVWGNPHQVIAGELTITEAQYSGYEYVGGLNLSGGSQLLNATSMAHADQLTSAAIGQPLALIIAGVTNPDDNTPAKAYAIWDGQVLNTLYYLPA